MGIRARRLPDQVHTGLEIITKQNFRKRDRARYDQFSSLHNLRRSPRLLQKTAHSTMGMEVSEPLQMVESPLVIRSQEGTLPVLRLRGGGPRKIIRKPTLQLSSRSTPSGMTVPSPTFGHQFIPF